MQIAHDANGHADAVMYIDSDGSLHRQKARVVVVAGNAIETPRLLLMSASPLFPDSLASFADPGAWGPGFAAILDGYENTAGM